MSFRSIALPLSGEAVQTWMSRVFSRAGLIAILLFGVAALPAKAMELEKAQASLGNWSTAKSLGLVDLKSADDHFSAVLGPKKVPALVFNTGSDAKPIWNIGIFPDKFDFGAIYKKGAAAVLGSVGLSDPTVVISQAKSTAKFGDLPKTVQDGIKKVFGPKIKTVAYRAGVNMSFTLDLGKTAGLDKLKSTLGVKDSKAGMGGQVGLDVVRYLITGKAGSRADELGDISLMARLSEIKPPKINRHVNAKNLFVRFAAGKDGTVRLSGSTTLSVDVDGTKIQFPARLAFEPKAKGADEALIAMSGAAKDLPAKFGGFALESLGLAARVTGEKKLVIGFTGEIKLKNKPAGFTAELSLDKLPPALSVDVNGDLSVADVVGTEIPGIGELAFRNASFNSDYVSGTVGFRGAETAASVIRSGNKKPVLVLLNKAFDTGLYLPGLAGSPLDQAALRDVAVIIVPKGSALKAVGAKDLPGPTGEMVAAAIGKRAKFQLNEGVNLVGAIDVKNSNYIDAVLSAVSIKTRTLPFAGKVSADILKDAKNARRPNKNDGSAAAKKILASLNIQMPIPAPKIPGISSLLDVGKPVFSIRGRENAETGEVSVATAIDGEISLKLPGKTLKTSGGLTLLKGNKNAVGFDLTSTSKVGWKKAFGIPFLEMNDIGVIASLKDDGSGKRSSRLALVSETTLGKQKVRTETDLVVVNGAIADISLSMPGKVDVAKLPGLGSIPGINEFAFEDMQLSLDTLGGSVTWKRIGVTTTALLTQIDGTYAAFLRVKDLKLGTLVPKIPKPFDGIKFPAAALAFSSKDLSETRLDELPKQMAVVMDGIVNDPEETLPIFDGVGLVGALSETDLPAPVRDLMWEIGVFKAVDGPLILSGAVNGIFKGVPKIGLYGRLPGFELPDNQPLSKVVSFDKGSADFFLRADVANTVFQLGAGGEMEVRVPHLDNPKKTDDLKFRGELYANVDLVSVAGSFKAGGSMKGNWRNPLGLGNLAIADPAFLIGVDTEGSVEFGIGGDATFEARNRQKLAYKADLLVNVNFSTTIPLPKKLLLRFEASKTSNMAAVEIADAVFRGVLTGPMSDVVVKLLPDKASKDAAGLLKAQLAKNSLLDILQVDKIPLPVTQTRNAVLYFATPGAVIPGRDSKGMGMILAGEPEIGLMGRTIKLGKLDTRLTLADGLKIYGTVPGFKLGPIALQGAGGKGDPLIDIGAAIPKSFPPGAADVPHFKISASSNLLGIKEDIDIDVGAEKIAFGYAKDLGGVVKVAIHARTEGENIAKVKDFTVKATTENNINGFLKDEVLPRLGVPKVVLDTTARLNPLEITGSIFEASARDFFGGKPVTLKLRHKYFGRPEREAIAKITPVWADPLDAFPVVPVAAAMAESFFATLKEDPLDVGGISLGLLRLNGAELGVDSRNRLYAKGSVNLMGLPFSRTSVVFDGTKGFEFHDEKDLSIPSKLGKLGELGRARTKLYYLLDWQRPKQVIGLEFHTAAFGQKDRFDLDLKGTLSELKASLRTTSPCVPVTGRANLDAKKLASIKKEIDSGKLLAPHEFFTLVNLKTDIDWPSFDKAFDCGDRVLKAVGSAATAVADETYKVGKQVVGFAGTSAKWGVDRLHDLGRAIGGIVKKATDKCAREGSRYDDAQDGSIRSLILSRRGKYNNQCVDVARCENKHGQRVLLSPCDGIWNQDWRLLDDGRIQNVGGRCLGARGGYGRHHNVGIYDCGDANVIRATIDTDNQIRVYNYQFLGDNRCLSFDKDGVLEIDECHAVDEEYAARFIWYNRRTRRHEMPTNNWETPFLLSNQFFNADYYRKNYPSYQTRKDLGFDSSEKSAWRHWILHGIRDGKQASPRFDIKAYLLRKNQHRVNIDWSNVNYALDFFELWEKGGKAGREGRPLDCEDDIHGAFNPCFYLKKYPELRDRFINNFFGAYRHWLEIGLDQGHQASASFSIADYKARYGHSESGRELFAYWLKTGRRQDGRPVAGIRLHNGAENQCADEESGKLTQGGPMILWTCNDQVARQYFENNQKGQLVTLNGQCLDLKSGKAKPGEPIILWSCNEGGNAMSRQRWEMVAYGAIRHVDSGLCLDATKNGTKRGNLVLSQCAITATQIWTAYDRDGKRQNGPDKPGPIAGSGFSGVMLANRKDFCVDEDSGKLTKGGPLIMWTCNGFERQLWHHNALGQITSKTNLCFDVKSGKARHGEPLILWACQRGGNAETRQKWRLLLSGRIQHASSGLCMDSTRGGGERGELVLAKCANEPTQFWTQRPADPAKAKRAARQPKKPEKKVQAIDKSGFSGVMLVNKKNLCADEDSGELTRGGKLIMWGCSGKERQRWHHNARGQITSKTKLCFDVKSGEARVSEPLILWSCNQGGSAEERQKWRLMTDGHIQHKASGLCMDATRNGEERGELVLARCSGTLTQIWTTKR